MDLLVWKKNNVGLGRNYRNTFELIVYGKKQESENFKEFRRDILEFNNPTNKLHPTQKPVDLIKYLIDIEDPKIILDPFLGSGTTAVAAKQLKRNFIGIEISEKYCEIARGRLRQEILL